MRGQTVDRFVDPAHRLNRVDAVKQIVSDVGDDGVEGRRLSEFVERLPDPAFQNAWQRSIKNCVGQAERSAMTGGNDKAERFRQRSLKR